MPEIDPALLDLIRHRREERNIEYKGSSGQEPFKWGPDTVNSRIARTAMAMANVGGGAIVIGLDQVQVYVNGRADPYVELAVRHAELEGRRFVTIQISGFRELPVVCTRNGAYLRESVVYTRPFAKHETAEIRTQSEMRELLDRAIEVGVQKRMRPIVEALQAALTAEPLMSDLSRFEAQRGEL